MVRIIQFLSESIPASVRAPVRWSESFTNRGIARASLQDVKRRPIASIRNYQRPTFRLGDGANPPPQVAALGTGTPVIGKRVGCWQFRRRPPGEVVPRIRIPLALAYHFGNGRRVGFLDQRQPCPDCRFLAGGQGCRWLPDGRGKGFRRYRVRVPFQNLGMSRLGIAGHLHRIAVEVVNQPASGKPSSFRQRRLLAGVRFALPWGLLLLRLLFLLLLPLPPWVE